MKSPLKSIRFEHFSVSALDLLTNNQAFYVYSTSKPNLEHPESWNLRDAEPANITESERPVDQMTLGFVLHFMKREGSSFREQA